MSYEREVGPDWKRCKYVISRLELDVWYENVPGIRHQRISLDDDGLKRIERIEKAIRTNIEVIKRHMVEDPRAHEVNLVYSGLLRHWQNYGYNLIEVRRSVNQAIERLQELDRDLEVYNE